MERYDVIVVGGGTAGMIAAMAAARGGARTLLVERDGYLGGTATYGIPFLGFFSGDGSQVVGGLPQELVDRMVALGGSTGHARGGTWKTGSGDYDYDFSLTPYDPEILKIAAQQMVLEAGAEIMFQAVLTGARCQDNRVASLSLMTVQGMAEVEGDVFVDATGDCMLTWMAGFPTEMRGRGRMQNVSHLIRMAQVDVEKMVQSLMAEDRILGLKDWHIRLVRGPLADGVEGYIHVAGHAQIWEDRPALTFTGVSWRSYEMSFNITRTTNIDPVDKADICKAEISERNNVYEVVRGLRENVPGFENAYLLSSPVRVGIREGRRIKGEFTLSEEDVVSGREFADGVARGAYPIDIHDPEGGKTQFTFIKGGSSYAVPYGCLLPQGAGNLLAAGRCVSTTGKALGSVRLMACCMAMGQAAGTAAALAVKAGVSPAELDHNQLRARLIEDKAILEVN